MVHNSEKQGCFDFIINPELLTLNHWFIVQGNHQEDEVQYLEGTDMTLKLDTLEIINNDVTSEKFGHYPEKDHRRSIGYGIIL